MAESVQPRLYHSQPTFPSGGLPRVLAGRKVELWLAVAGAAAAALFVFAPLSIALVGAPAILVLSAVESESFLLLVIFLMPVGWVLRADVPLRYVPVAARCLVIVGFFLGRLWRGRIDARGLLRPSVSWASLLFLGAALASAVLLRGAWTHESARSLYEMASYFGFYLLVLAWADSSQRIQKILTVLLCSTIVTAVFAIFQEIVGGYTSLWLYLNPPSDSFLPWGGRATSFLNYSNSLAGYLNLVLPFALACYALGKGKWRKLGAWTVGLGFIALVCTQSLGGLAAFGCVLILAIFCFVRPWRSRLLFLAGVCTLAIGFYVTREILNPAHVGSSVGYDAASRLLLWGTAWDLFVHSPVLGVGWGNFTELYGSYVTDFSWMPQGIFAVHNIYLQFLAETGLVGFTVFSLLIFRAIRQALRQLRGSEAVLDRALAFGVLGAVLTVLVHGLADFLFQVSPQFGTLFWTLLALLVVSGRMQSESALGKPGVSSRLA